MVQFFVEGGFAMLPVAVFGLVLLGTAGRYAWDGEPERLRFAIAMAVLLVATSLHAMLLDVAAVFAYVQSPERVRDADLVRVVFTGLMESTRPGALGGALLVLALVLVAIGVYRSGRRELRAAA